LARRLVYAARWFSCGEVEETVMVQRAAAKYIEEDEWEAWVLRNVGKGE
jgi:hypothetical protein